MLNSLTDYTNSLEVKIKGTLPGIFDLDEDAIHDFRVSVKKTRTVLNFLDYWSQGHSSRRLLMTPFRPIYKKTGRIRELQVHKELVPKLAELSGLEIDFLDKKINYQILRNEPYLQKISKNFKRQVPGIFKKVRKQIVIADKSRTRMDAAEAYQVRLSKRIQKLADSELPDLHKIRQLLKQKVYVFDAFQKSELLSFYSEFRAEWKILESTMGVWHDQLVFQEWLIPGLRWKRLNDEQYKTMMKLISFLRSSSGRMEKELIKTIQGK